MRHLYIGSLLLVFACAEGATSDLGDKTGGPTTSVGQTTVTASGAGGSTTADGGGGTGGDPVTGVGGAGVGGVGGVAVTSAGGSGGSGCQPGFTLCGIMCVDLQTDTNHCGGCGNICALGQNCMGGMCVGGSTSATTSTTTTATSTTATTTTATTVTTVTATSSSTGGGTCNPLNPGLVCGPNNHCIPQTNGIPICQAPTGSGIQYSVCQNNSQCAPIYECVNTPFMTVYCMQWCASDFDCPGWPFDTCYALNPRVYVGSQEWGICYDGLP